MLGLDPPTRQVGPDDQETKSEPIPTSIPGLVLMPPVYDPSGALLRSGKKARWLTQIRDLAADYVLLDLGAGSLIRRWIFSRRPTWGSASPFPNPPPSRRRTASCGRSSFAACAVRSPKSVTNFGWSSARCKICPAPHSARGDRGSQALRSSPRRFAISQLGTLHPRLAVSQTRVRSDLDFGPAMRALSERYLGIDLDYLGHIEHDDAVWLTVRRRRPLLIDSPTSKGRAQPRAHRPSRPRARRRARRPHHRGHASPRRARALTLYESLGALAGRHRRRDSPRVQAPAKRSTARGACLSRRWSMGPSSSQNRPASTRPTTRCSIRCGAAPTTCRRSPMIRRRRGARSAARRKGWPASCSCCRPSWHARSTPRRSSPVPCSKRCANRRGSRSPTSRPRRRSRSLTCGPSNKTRSKSSPRWCTPAASCKSSPNA